MGMLQMTWQPSLLKLKRKRGSPPLGLRNLGNTCYLNSVLQCLTYTPPLANFCIRYLHSSVCDFGAGKEKKGECPFCILEKRIARSLNSEAVSDAPLKINSCLRIYAEHFRSGRQEDAHEFLRYIIDACHNTCLRLKKLQQQRGRNGTANGGDIVVAGETIVKEIFGGALQSQIKCLSCGAESNKVDEIMDISLDILHSGSLGEALQKFFQPEVLDGNNKYKCDICKDLVVARKQMSILEAPNILVIQLKRFEGIFSRKIDKSITFDEILVLSSHMCKGSKDQEPEYSLFGTIVHSGFSPDSGHYYAYIKDAIGRWYCCNDSYVSVSTLQEALSEKVYILFFSRAKQRPQTRDDIDEDDEKLLEAFLSKEDRPERTLADIIVYRIKEKDAQVSSGVQPMPKLDDSIIELYKGVGKLLSKYTTGKLPKAFKHVPSLQFWEEVLHLTEPDKWSPNAMYQATRIFASNMGVKKAERFYKLVLLPRVREDIRKNKRLHFALYQSLKKALYKPAAFNKGILFSLCESRTCTLREAVIVGSIIEKISIPPLHSSVALLKLAEMEYCGTTSYFIKLLIEKKYALPYRVLDALVAHFMKFYDESRVMPVIWHQSLLAFAQRYKNELRKEDKDDLNILVQRQRHKLVTPEILRELNNSRNRGEKDSDPMSISTPLSVVNKAIQEDRFDIPDVPMEED